MNRPIEASWLAVRRNADAAARARSAPLVRMLGRALARSMSGSGSVSVVDVGAGTGANQAWLAPALRRAGYAGRQEWHLLDHDESLLEASTTADDNANNDDYLDIRSTRHTANVTEVASLLQELEPPRVLTCSALLDLLTAAEVDHLVQAARGLADAVLWALSVTGEVGLTPRHPDDGLVTDLFNADQQRRLDGDRVLLGPTAWSYAAQGLREVGWQVHTRPTPWRLSSAQGPLVRRWLDERADAAAGTSSDTDVHARLRGWAEARRANLDEGALAVRVGHCDLVALPEKVTSVQTSSPSW
ncbi:MAG: hypothetical protein WA892_04640 [Ornithinimicrobium sp.]